MTQENKPKIEFKLVLKNDTMRNYLCGIEVGYNIIERR